MQSGYAVIIKVQGDKMNIRKISLALLFQLIWAAYLPAMLQEQQGQQDALPPEVEATVRTTAEARAKERAGFEFRCHFNYERGTPYKEIYDQEYRKRYDELLDLYSDYYEVVKAPDGSLHCSLQGDEVTCRDMAGSDYTDIRAGCVSLTTLQVHPEVHPTQAKYADLIAEEWTPV